jgi:myosin heavy subunit
MSAAPFTANEVVFVNHAEDSWVVGRVLGVEANTARAVSTKKHNEWCFTVRTEDPERKQNGAVLTKVEEWNVAMCDAATLGKTPDDLLHLTHLHDSTLLRCLCLRYMNDVVYTNIGAIVVALNPFNYKIPHYQDDRLSKYLAENGQHIRDKLLPHSWTQAHNTYQDLKIDLKNQCILISGESGAGKTEATKIVLRYLSKVSALDCDQTAQRQAEGVLNNLVACSPVLESFGNARTVRNDNSSRFGKLMKVKFNQTYVIIGAHTTKYLLEKSRIVTASLNERVYHSFYLTMRSPTARDDYLFTQAPTKYRSVDSGKCIDNSEFNTAEDYEGVCECMVQLGMDKVAVRSTWRVAAAVVHQSNILFEPHGEGSTIPDGANGALALESAAALFGVPSAALLEEYTSTTMTVGGESVRKKLPVHKAADVRDALSKAVYEALFSQLVDRCNERCDVAAPNNTWIALLDIFGFEDFEVNSFEQLCINLANETLQGHYNEFIFRKDMEECRAEGIDVVDIQCPDNSPCVDLIAGPSGLLVILDDECSLGKGTDMGFFESAASRFDGKHPFFMKRKVARDNFIVKHYAGDVTYTVTGWLEKNRDTLKPELQQCLVKSSDKLVASLFADANGAAPTGGGKKTTVGAIFRKQLEELMTVINSTNPHWIRCIKPHPAKKPRMFGGTYTITQLESSGVLGTVKIRKAGYPVRWPHKVFAMRFQVIVPLSSTSQHNSPAQWKKHATAILAEVELLKKEHAQIGTTLIFLKADAYPLLEKRKAAYMKKWATILQQTGRGYLRRLKAFRSMKVRIIQRAARGIQERSALFQLYCEVNRSRLAEERAMRAKQEKFLADQARDRRTLESGETHARAAVGAQQESQMNTLAEDWHQAVRREKERVRISRLAESQRLEEIRLEQQRERWRVEMVAALKPIQVDEAGDREDITHEEVADYDDLRIREWRRRLDMKYNVLKRQLGLHEAHDRATIEQASTINHEEWFKVAAELRHRHDVLFLKVQYERELQLNRQRRARVAEEQRRRAGGLPRSAVEKILTEGTTPPGTNTDDAFLALEKEFGLSADPGVDVSPDRLFRRLQETSDATQQRATSRYHSANALQSANVTSPLRTVEIGSRVTCPSRHASGTVVELGPRRQFAPETFRVLLDNGDKVWMEIDDVRTPLPLDRHTVDVVRPPSSASNHRQVMSSPPAPPPALHRAAVIPYPSPEARDASARRQRHFAAWRADVMDGDW